MSMWRSGSHAYEPASFHAVPMRYSIQVLWALLTSALVLTLMIPGAGLAQEQTSADVSAPPKPASIGPPDPQVAKQSPSWEMRPGRSYLIPAFEILAYGFLLNLYDRHYTEPKDEYRTTGNTIRTHLT